MNINYSNRGVSTLCMSPSIFIALFLMISDSILIALPVFILCLVVCGIVYYRVVLQPIRLQLSTGGRYLLLLLAQIVLWFSVIAYNNVRLVTQSVTDMLSVIG